MAKAPATANDTKDDENNRLYANVDDIVAIIGKGPQTVRRLVREGVEQTDGSMFYLDADQQKIGKYIMYLITEESAREYLKRVQSGLINPRASDEMALKVRVKKTSDIPAILAAIRALDGVTVAELAPQKKTKVDGNGTDTDDDE
jgi:hypothetical protein